MHSNNIIIVDDHPLFCFGLEAIIKSCSSSRNFFRATSDTEVLDLIRMHPVDFIFMNIRMPKLDGFKAMHRVKQINPSIKIVGLFMNYYKNDALKMYKAGSNGYLLKSLSEAQIEKAVFAIMNGNDFFCDEDGCCFLNEKYLKCKQKICYDLREDLTDREVDILRLICEQFSTREISKQLLLSEKTIEIHRAHIIEKTHSKNMVGLVLYAIEKGIIKNYEKTFNKSF
ncbi:MAG: response regulator transcription factor [Bacteroidia bacterium]